MSIAWTPLRNLRGFRRWPVGLRILLFNHGHFTGTAGFDEVANRAAFGRPAAGVSSDDPPAVGRELFLFFAAAARPVGELTVLVVVVIAPRFAGDDGGVGIVGVVRYGLNPPLGVVHALFVVGAV